MKKKVNRLAAMGLTAAMVLGVTACGGSGGSGETAEVDTAQTNFKIFAGISALSPDNSEKPMVQQLNEAMGVTVEWNCVSGDTLTEKKNLVLNAGSDLPDALMGAQLTDSELITGGSSGLLIPLEDYINEETMPNLCKIIEKRPNLLASCTMPDGHIYGLPRPALAFRHARCPPAHTDGHRGTHSATAVFHLAHTVQNLKASLLGLFNVGIVADDQVASVSEPADKAPQLLQHPPAQHSLNLCRNPRFLSTHVVPGHFLPVVKHG